ncbi:response regulator transcription factor [Cohnella hashimotonis]|uniref:Response regulator n=1 Tax=Cohnella hashimotonis TaxID=2826895 RepID=A0ABT6TA47_9BACL|nr:response regulator [Cohnella hashimotonis]MDI4643695.1 response regulator [Cohnella hashimotonis]
MIRTLIVEDEALVREQMIRTLPWEANRIQIVGGVGSGRKALDFIGEHKIDLLITDLDMPHMSGIELMKSVRANHPQIQMVVLTCYQDFNYIQEAMRIGAIDYIVKTQLDMETVEDVLRRIGDRIAFEQGSRVAGMRSALPSVSGDGGLLLTASATEANVIDLYALDWIVPDRLMDVDQGSWFYACAPGEDRQANVDLFLAEPRLQQWAVTQVNGLGNIAAHELRSLLKNYIGYQLFYRYKRRDRVYEVDLSLPPSTESGDHDAQALQKEWLALTWLHDDRLFEELLQRTGREKPTPASLGHMFYSIFVEWTKMLDTGFQTASLIGQFERLRFWEDWTAWLEQTRAHIRQRLRKRIYSDEMVQSVMKAVEMMNDNIGADIKQDDIARRVNVSRSYFSQMFKNVVGRPFGDYVRLLRVNRAQSMLLQSNAPIYIVAKTCGFEDEKYFSKMFRDHIGLLPTEYRSLYQTKSDLCQTKT